MEKGKGLFQRWQYLLNLVKNGLFLYGLRNRLAKAGFDLEPYFIEIEGLSNARQPEIKDDPGAYELVRLTPDYIKKITESIIGLNLQEFDEMLNRNPVCIGLRHQGGNIAAYMLIDNGSYRFKNKTIPLQPNEAYLQGMYTFEDYRGKNLAPYLRFKSYQILRDEGKDRLYSITSYFNKSSLRFKQKLGVKHEDLRMSIVLFKEVYWDFSLKKYPDPEPEIAKAG